MLRSLQNQFLFLREFGSRFETTGSILPSSRFLAKAVTRYLAQRGEHSIRVLECGPGTGAFTDQIVRHLRPGDQFDLVELNASFVDALQRRFQAETHWRAVSDRVEIYQLPLQELDERLPYDFIISGLPHVNFPPHVVESITDAYFKLLKPGGTLSYFEYAYIRPLKKIFALGATRKKIVGVDRIMAGYLQEHGLRRDSVFLNVPPAWAQHLRVVPD